MRSTRHTVYVSAGKLPDELRQILLKRHGRPQNDLVVRAPRMLATFETAAEAERVANSLRRQRFQVLMSGPEQPPIADGWATVTEITDESAGVWQLKTSRGPVRLEGARVTAVSLLNWRPEPGVPTRAALITVEGQPNPLFIDGAALAESVTTGPNIEGLKRLSAFLEGLSLHAPPQVKVRSRQFTSTQLFGDFAEDDALQQALWVVDQLDTESATLPGPIRKAAPVEVPLEPSLVSLWSARALLVLGLLGAALSLALLVPIPFLSLELTLWQLGLAMPLFAWSAYRLSWARFVLGEQVLSFISGVMSRGAPVAAAAVTIDLILLGVAMLALGRGTPTHAMASGVLWLLGLSALPSLLSWLEQARDERA